jgi:hypothetical protein
VQQKLVKLSRIEAFEKSHERKKDTRRKIELGELVKKSGLWNEDPAVIFGAMIEASKKLQGNESEDIRKNWRTKGNTTTP